MGASNSSYLTGSAVTANTGTTAADHLIANAKPTFAAVDGVKNDEHFIDVTVSAVSGGKILLTSLTGSVLSGSTAMNGTLYLGTTTSSANQVATLSGGVFTFT